MTGRGERSAELERLLAADEELRWHGRPDRRTHVLSWLVSAVPLLFFAGPIVFLPTVFAVLVVGIRLRAGPVYLVGGLLFAAAVTLAVVVGCCYLLACRTHALAEYAVTDRRLLRFGGLVGREYSAVHLGDVEHLEVDVGPIEARYGTGSVSAVTAGDGGVEFSHVRAPYDVLETVESVRRGEPT